MWGRPFSSVPTYARLLSIAITGNQMSVVVVCSVQVTGESLHGSTSFPVSGQKFVYNVICEKICSWCCLEIYITCLRNGSMCSIDGKCFIVSVTFTPNCPV